ncbi:hypothetical protein [Novosphingopyxis sp.]|uniref:hypothetical protein n=1 Tax=Novosphingopyxis sp. TaxID=2709690 RepID=UPI003B596718
MTEETEPKHFLFIGDSDAGGAASQLAVADIPYHKKRLESRVPNWQSIIALLHGGDIVGVLVKLNTRAMERMALDEYADVREELFAGIAQHPHIVFVHESFYNDAQWNASRADADSADDVKDAEHDDWFGDDYFQPISAECAELVNDLIARYEINVVPYLRNVEINVLASNFIGEQQSNVLFRFYVPKGRIWAAETEAILRLFRDYLTETANIEVNQTSRSTATGTIYEFSGGEAVTSKEVSEQVETFSRMMDLCIRDPDGAERQLVAMGATKGNAGEVVERYTRQLRRISIDMRQEREKTMLRIRHRLEDELSEILPTSDLAALQSAVSLILPDDSSMIGSLGFAATPSPSAPGALTVNIRPQIIQQVQGIVAQEISGTINLSQGAIEMIRLIEKTGGNQAPNLKSAVYELEDPSTTAERRLSAKAKLKAFAFGAAKKTGDKLVDAGATALVAYLRGTLGI